MKPVVAGLILFVISLFFAVLIFFLGNKIGLTGFAQQIIAWACLTLVASLIFFLPLISRSLWLGWSGRYSDTKHLNPVDIQDDNDDSESTRLLNIAQRWERLKQFYELTRQYKEHRKPWVMVVGQEQLVEKYFPGIKDSLWIESHSAFWLDAKAVEPAGGWHVLRGAGKQPAEGVVYLREYDKTNSEENCSTDLQNVFKKIGWSLPVNVVYVRDRDSTGNSAVISHALNAQYSDQASMKTELDAFALKLAIVGTDAIENNINNTFAARLSRKLEADNKNISASLFADKRALNKLNSISRISFIQVGQSESLPDLVFKSFNTINIFNKGRKLQYSKPEKIFLGLSATALFAFSMFAYSAYSNSKDISQVHGKIEHLAADEFSSSNLSPLIDLQNQINSLEKSTANNWLAKALGYDYREELLNLAYAQYGATTKQVVIAPVASGLTNKLKEMNSLSFADTESAPEGYEGFYDTLKAYLMLTEKIDKVDEKFLSERIFTTLEQQGIATDQMQSIVPFFVANLSQHTDWAMESNADLINNSRQILSVWFGEDQAGERIYNRIIQEAKERYVDLPLAKLLDRDIQGIWIASKSLPGIYTRRAWEGYIKPAFEQAAKGSSNNDWVLDADTKEKPINEITINAFKERYFNDYAAAWYDLLNSIAWKPQKKILDTVNQLHIYADPQRSPLVALFSAIKTNGTIDSKQLAVNPALASKAKRAAVGRLSSRGRQALNILLDKQSEKVDEVKEQVTQYLASPLELKFENLLQLVDADVNPKSDLSLQRYLEKATSTKQRLIQIAGASDTGSAARAMVQNVLAGESNEFADGLQYARIIEAGIGDRLLPFARNVFISPFYTSWGEIAGLAQHNIDSMWNQSLVTPMKKDLGGRYPFTSAETEVSIPMMAKYLDPDQGLLNQFIQNQLSGVLIKQGNQWVTAPNPELKVSKEFISRINKLESVANDFFVRGEGSYTFELKPASTVGITQFNLMIDGQSLDYFNQEAQWQPLKWPGNTSNAGVRLTWESEEGGVRQSKEFDGRLGFIRMLEKSRITPVDSSTYLVESPVGQEKALRFYMRTNSGKGPLGLLELRSIQIPSKIFETS
ncbi:MULTISPECIES: ImcF-related family protein [unclassified Neisseria]|uniref:ImcF-related family protein n=1 Tax=unclassified Neisseria TaxID=2623750 RepID=UPI002665C111|nr:MULTISPECIES: ImcF-related family protein [unclassified Neisseria]MDO1509199.1 ImcF-related family protein [Neisseria sp. MVDL19-042950]MDO1515522.1 ImcF-related family protein [Neisseria sp. MVDL18-041461]MDO1562881.1 ImcF-related family protein [Neisseria sp. MVDL20-010259]